MASRPKTPPGGLFDHLDDHADQASPITDLPDDWKSALPEMVASSSMRQLGQFLVAEREAHVIFPPANDVFNAFRSTPLKQVRVVILGQDPYHDDGQAHGLSFSVLPGVAKPPSLKNILREWHDDLGHPKPADGCLLPWANQGVLLLNTILTVRAHEAASHRKRGWEEFTDAAITAVSEHCERVVFLLWGAPAGKKAVLIDPSKHLILTAPHPSPLSAHRGFFGSRPFSATNAYFRKQGFGEIDWRL